MNRDLILALSLADAADEQTLEHFGARNLAVRTKSDRSPVSEADEAVEQMMRERLRLERHADGVVGEEFGDSGAAARRWIIDPIDGTRNYIRGVPVWATLIALEVEGVLKIGVVSAPALGRRWWAARGEGAFLNDLPIRVSSVSRLEDAFLSYDSVTDFDAHGLSDPFLKLVRTCGRTRGFGDFWSHMLVAQGAVDIAIEPTVAFWDMAAIQVIVEEAGGRFTSLAGEPRADQRSGVSTNGLLHDAVLGSLR